VPVTFTFKPSADGRSALMSGRATVHRLDFGVGQGEWQDTKWLGDEVRIRFELTLRK
jgi:polyisoprenoid-binding protein YceI